ncbi:hypothetical protein FRC0314_01944 [Corynebacterium diphtheriae]|nr:hypothetical protein FRC0314_01944 [Corynebacterium diphtheriae]
MNHLSVQDMFECRIGSYECGSHLVNQTCVGMGDDVGVAYIGFGVADVDA